MKITDIETDKKCIFRFMYKEKTYSMNVDIIAKSSKYIIIPAILNNNQVLDPSLVTEAVFIYTVKDGVFMYTNINVSTSVIMDMRVYLLSSEEDIARVNRREAYRVFIGEITKMITVSRGGRKRLQEGILKDVSVIGMGVVLKSDLEIGSGISILYNYEGLNVHLVGEIVRKNKLGRYRAFTYGCRFREPNNNINRIVVLKQIKNKNDTAE